MADEGVTPNSETELSPETLALAEKGRSGTVELTDPAAPKKIPAPAGVPEKFWDPIAGTMRTDDLVKAYSELEKKLGGSKDETDPDPDLNADPDPDPNADPDPDPNADPDGGDGDPGETPALTKAIDDAAAAYAEKGELDDAARQPLREAGISDEQIDYYLAGIKATEASLQTAATEAFGGSMDSFNEAVAWAAQNWTEKQIKAFNAQTGSVETMKIAAAGLAAAYKAANPGEGKLINVNSGSNRGDVYTSMAQFTKDLREADAIRDGEARKEAIAKLARSREAKSIK